MIAAGDCLSDALGGPGDDNGLLFKGDQFVQFGYSFVVLSSTVLTLSPTMHNSASILWGVCGVGVLTWSKTLPMGFRPSPPHTDRRVTGDPETQGSVHILGDSDPGTPHPFRAFNRLHKGKIRAGHRSMVIGQLKVERLPQIAWPHRQAGEWDAAAASKSIILAGDHFAGTQQHTLPGTLRGADDIAGAVDSIGDVDIHMTTGAEHRRIARSLAAVGVGGRILRTEVGLHLCQADRYPVMCDGAAQELWCDDICGLEEIDVHGTNI